MLKGIVYLNYFCLKTNTLITINQCVFAVLNDDMKKYPLQ